MVAYFNLAIFVACLVADCECLAQGVVPQLTADEIRFEACLPNQNDIGYPLPLAAHWNSGQKPNGFSPEYQMDLIDKGYHLLPWFTLPLRGVPGQDLGYEYFETAIKKAAKLRLPISFISTQWESLLSFDPRYLNLPTNQNPNVIDSNGKVSAMVQPFGPVELWREVGMKWTSGPVLKRLQELYPEPPLVLFISNNEHPKIRWWEVEKSKQFIEQYGKGKDANFKRRIIGEGWVQRYRSLQAGMREGLTSAQWKEKAVFIGFVAFGTPDFGRRSDWMNDSLYIPGRLEPWPLAWDGASAQFYVMNLPQFNDFTLFSPQVEAMNYTFMLKEARELNPGFWFEFSTWDGHDTSNDKRVFYTSRGQLFSPERYEGMTKFGMWLLRPRVVREYRHWDDTIKESGDYFIAIADAIEMVHSNITLRRFWRYGQLMANNHRQHPFQLNIPEEYRKIDRWFLISTSLDPPLPWTMSTEFPVFALGLVLGEAPEREWLVYAHSPLKDRKDVRVNLPGYGSVMINVGVAGNYYHILEKNREIKLVPGSE